MDKPAVIAGSLIDIKNVAVHKSVRLSIDVPAEMAQEVIRAFGWPTGANPVSVAVARLAEAPVAQRIEHSVPNREAADSSSAGGANSPFSNAQSAGRQTRTTTDATTAVAAQAAKPGKDRRHWSSLTFAEQSGIRCAEPAFWRYLSEVMSKHPIDNDLEAARFVRHWCGVESRSELKPLTPAGKAWADLDSQFDLWMRDAA